jgi:prepilin-type N-terminal cleavage/methylation domain-containing protein
VNNQKGFTLLEVMIAFALLTSILFVAVISQSSSLGSSTRSKNILMATNLARNLINEQELKYEGLPFERLPKTEEGTFAAPNDGYKWTLTFEEVDFSVMSDLIAKQSQGAGDSQDAQTETVVKLFEDYLKKSVRRMTVIVHYPDSGQLSKLSFTQLLVNYDADFATGL